MEIRHFWIDQCPNFGLKKCYNSENDLKGDQNDYFNYE